MEWNTAGAASCGVRRRGGSALVSVMTCSTTTSSGTNMEVVNSGTACQAGVCVCVEGVGGGG